jgi:hypothetical protein
MGGQRKHVKTALRSGSLCSRHIASAMLGGQPVPDEASCRPLSSIVRMTFSANVICSTSTSCHMRTPSPPA